jgi:hypothetical protein
MQLTLALLLSIILHTALIVAPNWLAAKQRPLLRPSVEARLLPPVAPARNHGGGSQYRGHDRSAPSSVASGAPTRP